MWERERVVEKSERASERASERERARERKSERKRERERERERERDFTETRDSVPTLRENRKVSAASAHDAKTDFVFVHSTLESTSRLRAKREHGLRG